MMLLYSFSENAVDNLLLCVSWQKDYIRFVLRKFKVSCSTSYYNP